MSVSLSHFGVRVLESGQTPLYDEAVILIDGGDRLARLGLHAGVTSRTWVGLHPVRILGDSSPLLAGTEPKDAYVALCNCRELGCGALVARIRRERDLVVWDNFRHGSDANAQQHPLEAEPMCFAADLYTDAIAHRVPDGTTWRPHTRDATEMANQELTTWSSAGLRLKVGGWMHLDDRRVSGRFFLGEKGDADRAFLVTTMDREAEEDAAALAERLVAYTTTGAVLTDERTVRSPMGS